MTATPSQDLVLVEYEYEYTTRDGGLVSIRPNERYILLCKTNNHWWHVRKDEKTKPFYVPAQYVKELPSNVPSPLHGQITSDLLRKHVDLPAQKPNEVTIRVRPSANCGANPIIRMSTFGIPQDIPDLARSLKDLSVGERRTRSHSLGDSWQHIKRCSFTPDTSLGSQVAEDDCQNLPPRSRVPSFNPADAIIRPTQVKPVDALIIKGAEQKELEKQTKPSLENSQLSENVYEFTEDIKDIELKTSEETENDVPPAASLASDPPSITALIPVPYPASAQAKYEGSETAVYVNVAELQKNSPQSPASLAFEEWEVHTDQESGQEFYYNPLTGQTTWEKPFSPQTDSEFSQEDLPSPLLPSHLSSLADLVESDWEKLFDESSGCHYFYNHVTGETSWDLPERPLSSSMDPLGTHRFREDAPPPLPEEDYPTSSPEELGLMVTYPKDFSFSHWNRTIIPRASLDSGTPTGWTQSVDLDGQLVFTSDVTQEQWIKSVDDRGQVYYYLRDGSKSQWNLPEVSVTGQPRLGNGVNQDGVSVFKTWRHIAGPSQFNLSQDNLEFLPAHKRNISYYGSDVSSSGNSPKLQHHLDRFGHQRNPSIQSGECQQLNILEKAGILNKTKVSENGKKLRKNWTQSWTVLHGGVLTFHKDPKSAPAGSSSKTNQIVPEFTVELRGATISWASKDKSSKKNVLELKTRTGAEFLIQYDNDSIITDWHKVITDTVRQLEHSHDEEDGEGPKKSGALVSDPEQKKVRTKLLKFLQKRPTLQSVKDKGYIKDNIFGCPLETLCAQEKTTIPRFVEKCINAVEKRGLDIDGIYRVSGNLAVIQKLRHKADHDELDLEDGQWEDIHVITGALKLFFRELPEPLFPYSHFNNFIAAIKIADYSQKVTYMHDLVKSLPPSNRDTMKLLFQHLRRVIDYGEENRMSVQNVAIVFGPTLLKPETESANITMHMVFQNQIVEFILNEYDKIF